MPTFRCTTCGEPSGDAAGRCRACGSRTFTLSRAARDPVLRLDRPAAQVVPIGDAPSLRPDAREGVALSRRT
jgi:DNA-directed RNA polymerase subunit RPC12/RpoP